MNVIDTLFWIRSFQVNPVVINFDMLPPSLTWKSLCEHLVQLSRTRKLTYSRQSSNSFSVSVSADKSELPLWQPTNDLQNKLRHYGYSSTKITELLNRYLNEGGPKEDREFLNYCISQVPLHQELLYVPQDWQPSVDALDKLRHIDNQTLAFYLEEFRHVYSATPAYLPSFDKLFIRFVLDDHRKSDIKIPPGWFPSKPVYDEILAILSSRNMLNPASHLDLFVSEYRLYWSERGSRRTDWDSHFLRRAKEKL